jgi:hypothetical protein
MTPPTPAAVLAALKATGLPLIAVPGWDHTDLGGWAGAAWNPHGVLLHHTANGGATGDAPSLGWVIRNEFFPTRACNVLISRTGIVHLITAWGCFHAGGGGPLAIDGFTMPADQGNAFLFGIEIESKGLDAKVTASTSEVDGFTPAQVRAAAKVAAALCKLLGKTETAVIRHRDWAPGRKTDVLQPLAFWRALIKTELHPVLAAPAPAARPAPFAQEGVDYSYGRPNLAQLKVAGKHFVVRYLSGGGLKDATALEIKELRDAGLTVVFVWENGADAALRGAARGAIDAAAALKQAKALGIPTQVPLYFAVDVDVTFEQRAAVVAYFAAVAKVVGPVHTGVYGSYNVIEWLAAAKVATWFWMTYAWPGPGGAVHPLAHLYQYRNNAQLAGSAVDLDRALRVNFGGWAPTPVGVPPKPVPVPLPLPIVTKIPVPVPVPVPLPVQPVQPAPTAPAAVWAGFFTRLWVWAKATFGF